MKTRRPTKGHEEEKTTETQRHRDTETQRRAPAIRRDGLLCRPTSTAGIEPRYEPPGIVRGSYLGSILAVPPLRGARRIDPAR